MGHDRMGVGGGRNNDINAVKMHGGGVTSRSLHLIGLIDLAVMI
jgi:hypothetical protein